MASESESSGLTADAAVALQVESLGTQVTTLFEQVATQATQVNDLCESMQTQAAYFRRWNALFAAQPQTPSTSTSTSTSTHG